MNGFDDDVTLGVAESESGEGRANLGRFKSGSVLYLHPGRAVIAVSADGYRPEPRVVSLRMGDSIQEARFGIRSLDQWPDGHQTLIVDEQGQPFSSGYCWFGEVEGISTDAIAGRLVHDDRRAWKR